MDSQCLVAMDNCCGIFDLIFIDKGAVNNNKYAMSMPSFFPKDG